jgi:hypothetical protein
VLLARRARASVSQAQMAQLLGKPDWTGGVVLAGLEALARRALADLKVPATLSRVHATGDAADLAAFRDRLVELEAGRVLLVVNYTLAPILAVGLGHYSPVGAFDAGADRVLVLDTYRQGWEPYWAPCSLLWDAMCTQDAEAGAARGFLEVRDVGQGPSGQGGPGPGLATVAR